MRIIQAGQGVGVNLKDVLAVVLLYPLELVLIAFLQGAHQVILRFFRQFEAQYLVLELLAPAVIEFSAAGSPAALLDIDLVSLINAEVHCGNGLGEILQFLFQARLEALLKAVENEKARIQVAFG